MAPDNLIRWSGGILVFIGTCGVITYPLAFFYAWLFVHRAKPVDIATYRLACEERLQTFELAGFLARAFPAGSPGLRSCSASCAHARADRLPRRPRRPRVDVRRRHVMLSGRPMKRPQQHLADRLPRIPVVR